MSIKKLTALILATSAILGTNIGAAEASVATAPIQTEVIAGEQIDTYQIEVKPGSGQLGMSWGQPNPLLRTAWGASYAITTEYAFLHYVGRAKAAGNVYANVRYVQVCIWYTRSNVMVSDKVCSKASSASGNWVSGPEVTVDAWDSLGLNDPPTLFNIQTTKINPSVF